VDYSIFMLGHRVEDDAAVSELVGGPAARFFTLAHRTECCQTRPSYRGIKSDPFLRNLESGPRYKAFLRKMNLPE
jgi:hypothetical protein